MSRNASLHVTDPGVVFRALGAALVDFVGDHVQNASTNKSSHDDGHHTADHEPKVLLFLFFAFTVGREWSATCMYMNKNWLAMNVGLFSMLCVYVHVCVVCMMQLLCGTC